MSEFEIDQFDPAESQLFLTSNILYNLRSEKTFLKTIENTSKLRVDGMLTQQGYGWRSSNVYDQTHGIFIIDGVGYKGRFDNFRKPKTMFNYTDEGELCLMLIHSLMFDRGEIDEDNKIFTPIQRDTSWGDRHFSFVLNTKMPSVDILAARLLMDN